MNRDQAKAIPLHEMVERLGGRFSHRRKPGQACYYSPLRPEEHSPSFYIYEFENRWHDYGHLSPTARSSSVGSGGDIIDLWCDYHGLDRKSDFSQALKGIGEIFGSIGPYTAKRSNNVKAKTVEKVMPPRFKILSLSERITHGALRGELERRNISLATAQAYLQQAIIQDANYPLRKLNGFAFENDKHSYELSIPNARTGKCFKTAIAPKSLSTIEGPDKTSAWVFEGFWDFLTYLQMNKKLKPDCNAYILNSVSFSGFLVEQFIAAEDTLKNIKLFLNNDPAGEKATTFILDQLEPHDFTIGTMEHLYKGYNDLSNYWSDRNKPRDNSLSA